MAFSKLGVSEIVDRFGIICLSVIYGKQKMTSVDEARYSIWHVHFVPKRGLNPLEIIKGCDPGMQTSYSLVEKIKWTKLVSRVYKRAANRNPQHHKSGGKWDEPGILWCIIVFRRFWSCRGLDWSSSGRHSVTLEEFDDHHLPMDTINLCISTNIEYFNEN